VTVAKAKEPLVPMLEEEIAAFELEEHRPPA
jgi:hypothetical protein